MPACTSRSSSSGRATSRSRCSPTGERTDAPGRARVLDPAAAPEAGRGGALGRGRRRSSASGWARPPSPRPRRWATAAPAPASSSSRADGSLLLPRDEHPDPGRAPGDRAGLRRGPGAGAAPHRRGRADAGALGLAPPARLGHGVPDHQRGSRQRVPALHRPDRVPARPRRPRRALGRRGRSRATRSRLLLRLDARQADRLGPRPRRRPSPGWRARSTSWSIARCRHQPGLPSAAAGRSAPSGRATSTSSSSTAAPTCWQPAPIGAARRSSWPSPPRWRRTRRAASPPSGWWRTTSDAKRAWLERARLEGLR